jgi:hypothetical protein
MYCSDDAKQSRPLFRSAGTVIIPRIFKLFDDAEEQAQDDPYLSWCVHALICIERAASQQ